MAAEWRAVSDQPLTSGKDHQLRVVLDDKEADELIDWAQAVRGSGAGPVAERVADKLLERNVWYERPEGR